MKTPEKNMHEQQFSLRVAHIDEIPSESRVHRWSILRFKGEPIGVTISTDFRLDPASPDILHLRLTAHYHTVRCQIIRPLLDYAIEVKFEVENLREMVSEGDHELMLPTGLASLTLSLGIGAMRGMIALGVRNTFLSHYPLPVFRISDIVNSISGPDGDTAGTGRLATIRLSSV